MRFAGYFIHLIPFFLSRLVASSPILHKTNFTLLSANLNSSSLGEAHYREVALRDNDAFLNINYFDNAMIPRRALLSTLGPARREIRELTAFYGKDTVMLGRYQRGLPGCWFYMKNWAERPTKRMTYGILNETIEILYKEMIAEADFPFVSYIDIFEGRNPFGARIGEVVVEDTKPSDWGIVPGPAATGVATS